MAGVGWRSMSGFVVLAVVVAIVAVAAAVVVFVVVKVVEEVEAQSVMQEHGYVVFEVAELAQEFV